MTSSNPAAVQGWIKSVDPKSGRVFYANHITRKTQWEAPEGWRDEVVPSYSSGGQQKASRDDDCDNDPLPSNWEVMHDPTTGKPFYVDHERKITTWTRPRPEKADTSMSLRPATAASPTSGNSSTLNRILQQHQQNSMSTRRSYQQEASYYQTATTHSTDVDFSDSLPKLDFTVKKVSDSLRPSCPGCGIIFSMTLRRHHCRLCGDVFCDSCSNHRCTLPLDGPEFEKPVRVCDFCFKDVDAGNFFSTRRYLTVLHLYEPNTTKKRSDDEAGVATEGNVNAALSALCQDLQQMIQAGDTSLHEKITISPEILLPEILKHLKQRETAERAICCVAALLALETLAGDQKADFTTAVYLYGKKDSIDDILKILERNGKDRRLLYVQEQAARTLYYLTESRIIAATTRKLSELEGDDDDIGSADECLDILRSMRILLDHASGTQNPNLQRWTVACLRNLVVEDERRATMAVNNVAAIVASESSVRNVKLDYESCVDELVNSGGLIILGSLISSDDADIRAHAVSTLNATLTSTRAVDASMAALSEMTGGEFGRTTSKEGDIIRAIVAGGGCGASVTPLLLSAENSVAGMGCSLLSSLVLPLLTDPAASASLSPKYDYRKDQTTSVGACREASIEIASGSCLPALLSLAREQGAARPLELRVIAMTALAAVVSSIGEMGRSWAQGAYEEGLERMGAPNKLKEAILLLNEEDVIDVALQILLSGSGQSLGSNKDTPTARIRESAGIVLGALTSCSAEAIMTIQNKNVLSPLIQASMDASMTIPSTLRVDGAPRCQGVLDTVASVLMFAWQHSSGASNELLDKLIEMIDTGAIPYASRVLNNKIDWDSRDKAVGSMRGRIASCKLLACLFGIALTNDNSIGMRRLMDAVESDARSYRGSSDGKQSVPSNIIEASLSCLQTASNQAKKIVMGGTHHGHHYQTALMDLVEASLLAVGSMCGSSIAPGGSQGTMVTGESFLVSRNDMFVGRRKEICNVACDVVVRGGRSGPTLLPTMIVGGFGEGSVLASLRLALAIAQNGNQDQHAKLAHCGILVPISDILKAALSSGDIYKFSSSLTLVRLCGPYIAAGHGGGLESVRDAIRVATNVLTLPVNPESTLKQMETQEGLKSECIVALEALSRNASLWSAISSEALPSLVQCLHMSAHVSGTQNPRSQKTKIGALRAVLQIVQVPSHAIAAAEANILDPICKLLYVDGSITQDIQIPLLAMEILHVIAKSPEARRKVKLLDADTIRGLCSIIAKAATSEPSQPADSRADITFIGLEVLHLVLSESEKNVPTADFLQSHEAHIFLASIVSEPKFVRALCATMLISTNMRIQQHETDSLDETYKIPPIYGHPLIKVKGKCAGYPDTHDAAESLLFNACTYACASASQYGEAFWEIFLLQDLYGTHGAEECVKAATSLVAHFLQLLHSDHTPFFPMDGNKIEDFTLITRPLVRHRLLEALNFSVSEISGDNIYSATQDPFLTSLLVQFQIPQVCLALWKDPALLDLAFELIKNIVGKDADDVLHLFVAEKSAILSLFDLLNLDDASAVSTNTTEIRKFLASVLGQLAESGLLQSAVERFDVKSSAIAALAAACLSEEGRMSIPDEDEDVTANRLSTVLMRCLVDLCSVKDENSPSLHSRIRLSQAEASAIASNLGKKLCHMVLSRFLERSKLQQYDMEEDDDDITHAPDVAMLCAIAQHQEALLTLRSIGGLHALSLIAAEGEISALLALRKACMNDASVLLEGETYQSMMKLVCSKQSKDSRLEGAALDLLAQLSIGSLAGRVAVSSSSFSPDCVSRAIDIIVSLVSVRNRNASVDVDIVDRDEADTPTNDEEVENTQKADMDVASPEIAIKDIQEDTASLGCAACALLSALVPSRAARSCLMGNSLGVEALVMLARESPVFPIKLSSLQLIMSLAAYASEDSNLSPSTIFELATSILSSSFQLKSTPDLNVNRFHLAVVEALSIVFDTVGEIEQKNAARLCTGLFTKSVNNCIVIKTTTTEEDRSYSAELTYSLSSIMLMVRGKTGLNDVFKKEILASIVNLVQWRLDPKSTMGKTNQQFWDGSVANCLMLLSLLFSQPEESLKKSGLNLKAIISTPLMLARAGKAPRKAIDFRSALELLAAGADSTAAILASRLLKYLANCE